MKRSVTCFLKLRPSIVTSCCTKLRMRTTTGKHVICLALCSTVLLLPSLWHHLAYRASNKNTTAEDIQEAKKVNAQRLEKADTFLRETSESDILEVLARANKGSDGERSTLDLAIAVITNVRQKNEPESVYRPRYLTQVISELIKLFNSTSGVPLDTRLFLCNVEQQPDLHTEARGFSNILKGFTPRSPRLQLDTFEVEKRDYVFCLTETLRYRPRYVLMLEDDALPNENFWSILNFVTSQLDVRLGEDAEVTKAEKVAYVKLYHPEHLLEYASGLTWERVCELLGISLTLSTVFTLWYAWILEKLRRFSGLNIYALWIALGLCIVLAMLAIGRAPILKLRTRMGSRFYALVQAPSCCTQAVLFPRHNIRAVVDFLGSATCRKDYAKDSALETFVRVSGLESYQTLPNAFTHIGLVSSVRKRYVNPRGLS